MEALQIQEHERRLILDGLNTQKTVLQRNIEAFKTKGIVDVKFQGYVDVRLFTKKLRDFLTFDKATQ